MKWPFLSAESKKSIHKHDSLTGVNDDLGAILKSLKEQIDQRLILQASLREELKWAESEIEKIQLSLRPKLAIALKTKLDSNDVGIYVVNSGMGNAYIRDFKVTYKGISINELYKVDEEGFTFWEVLIEQMELKRKSFWTNNLSASSGFGHIQKISPGEDIYVIRLSPKYSKRTKANEFIKALRGLTFEVTYYSSINKSYTVVRSRWTPMSVNR